MDRAWSYLEARFRLKIRQSVELRLDEDIEANPEGPDI